MKLRIVTKAGKEHTFKVSSTAEIIEKLMLVRDSIAFYTLMRS